MEVELYILIPHYFSEIRVTAFLIARFESSPNRYGGAMELPEMIRWVCRGILLGALLLGVQGYSRAATIHVRPGTGTLQAAIDGATAGDTIRVHAGVYSESIQITKPLQLVGDSAADVMIDGGCSPETAVEVLADKVAVRGVTVTGGTLYSLDIDNRDRITISNSIFLRSCSSGEYGVNVFHSTHVLVNRNLASGYGDAGIYIGGTDPDAHVFVVKNTCTNNFRGITVEDVTFGGKSVFLDSNRAFNNTSTGIILEASDGVRIRYSIVMNNADVGILLDDSDENRLIGNRISGNPTDVVDHGLSNCWKKNHFTSGTLGANGCP